MIDKMGETKQNRTKPNQLYSLNPPGILLCISKWNKKSFCTILFQERKCFLGSKLLNQRGLDGNITFEIYLKIQIIDSSFYSISFYICFDFFLRELVFSGRKELRIIAILKDLFSSHFELYSY